MQRSPRTLVPRASSNSGLVRTCAVSGSRRSPAPSAALGVCSVTSAQSPWQPRQSRCRARSQPARSGSQEPGVWAGAGATTSSGTRRSRARNGAGVSIAGVAGEGAIGHRRSRSLLASCRGLLSERGKRTIEALAQAPRADAPAARAARRQPGVHRRPWSRRGAEGDRRGVQDSRGWPRLGPLSGHHDA